MRYTFFLVLLFTSLLSVIISQDACNCPLSAELYPTTVFNNSAATFSGTVININIVSATESRITFCVNSIWKGPKGTKYMVRTNPAVENCGYPFKFGTAYLVYAENKDGKFWVTGCSRSNELSYAQFDVNNLPAPLYTLPGTC